MFAALWQGHFFDSKAKKQAHSKAMQLFSQRRYRTKERARKPQMWLREVYIP
jgi:hypothetical protein